MRIEKRKIVALLAIFAAGSFFAWNSGEESLTDTFVSGNPDVKHAGVMAFGPEGVLFLGDSKSGAVFALDVADNAAGSDSEPIRLNSIDQKVAQMLGAASDQVMFNDLAVHPKSKNVYLSVSRGRGDDAQPALLRVHQSGKIEEVRLDKIRYSKADVSNAPAEDAKDRRGRSLRTQAITDLSFADGHVYVAGLSNEEFASNLRRIPFPFKDKMAASSVEIYHGAHGKYETHAPIRTFMHYELDEEPHILAAYTCTPLVAFPTKALDDADHVKGKTVAELGSGNRPLDILSFKGGDEKEYILLSNSNRTLMKIDPQDIPKTDAITEPVKGRNSTAGVDFTAVSQVGILQMDNLNDANVVVLKRDMNSGALNLLSIAKRRL